jgi:trimeric autotransporter adhesin
MKKLTFVALLLILNIVSFSQNLNGKLGTGGQFIIRDTTTTFLTLSQSSGYLSLNRSLILPYTTNSSLGVMYKGNERFLHNYGTENTFLGINSGNFTMSGAYNTVVGYYSFLSNTTGYNNTSVGHYSLSANTTGYNNTAVGFLSLRYNTTGIENTAFGEGALSNNTTANSNVAVGEKSLYFNTTGSQNSAFGWYSLYSNTTGSHNTAFGVSSLNLNTTGNNNIAIGWNAQVPSATSDNQVRIGNILVTYAGVQVPWTITSDIRLKENILHSNLGLCFINKLNPVSYIRKNDESRKTEYGFIAQEVEAVLKDEGVDNNGMITIDDNGMYELRYNDLLAPMVKSIQELKAENDELKNKLDKFEQMQNVLVNEIEKLKSKDGDIKEVKLVENR